MSDRNSIASALMAFPTRDQIHNAVGPMLMMQPEQRLASGMMPYVSQMDPMVAGRDLPDAPMHDPYQQNLRYSTGVRPPPDMRDQIVSNKDVQNALMMGGRGYPEGTVMRYGRPYTTDPESFAMPEIRPKTDQGTDAMEMQGAPGENILGEDPYSTPMFPDVDI